MADNITVLDSAGVEKTIATKELAGAVHANKNILINEAGYITIDPNLDIARDFYTGISKVNKFGRSTNVDQNEDTDVWDGANSSDDEKIWVAPTQARVHNITSTSTSDDGAPVGVGARTIKIYGLTDWDTPEVSETVSLNGTSDVATSNSYVIIHRMKVVTWGATSINVGTIKATAVTDGTVTAQINAGEGQTQMAIYGIASNQTIALPQYYCSAIRSASSLSVKVSLLVNTNPAVELTNFLVKHTMGIATEGTSYAAHRWSPYYTVDGPAIIKIQANSSIGNTDVSAGFDGIIKDD